MLVKLGLSAAVCALVSTAAMAREDQVKVGPAPKWATLSEPLPVPDDQRGALFVRRQDSEVHLDKDGQSTFVAYRTRILQSNALQLGNISISWNPAAGAPLVHTLTVYRDGIARDVLKDSHFEILRREDQLEQSMLSGILTAVLQVPDLRVGDELELSYTVREQDPTMGSDSFGLLFLVNSPPPGRFRFGLSWDDGQEPRLLISPDLEAIVQRSNQAISINADMLATMNPPKSAPPRYSWQRIAQFSDFDGWQSVSRRFAPLYAEAATLDQNSPLKEEAARIAAAHDNEKDRAEAALALVQQQVRYIYIGLNSGNLTPARADQTWERRYGDCKGKTAMLLALLGQLGIEAEAVLANNSNGDDGLDQRLPNPGMFDHVLVRAQIDGKAYWLDGTLPKVVVASQAPIMPYRWVLPLSAEGKALEQVPWKPAVAPDNLVLYEIDARDGIDQTARIEITTVKRGIVGLGEYFQFSSVTDEQLENAVRQNAEGGSSWNTVEHVTYRYDVATQASVLKISGTGPVDWEGDEGGERWLTLPGGGFNPPDRRQRGSDQDKSAPFYQEPEFDCRVTSVRLPRQTAAKDWSYNTSFEKQFFGNNFRRSFERRDGTIRMVRSSKTWQTEITPAEAAKDNARLTDFDNSMARIFYDRNSADGPGSGKKVAATFEGDWINDATSCDGHWEKDQKQ